MRCPRLFCACWLAALLCACDATEQNARPGAAGEPPAAAGAAGDVEGDNAVMDGMGEPGRASAPTLENGRYVFRAGELELEINPALGGRVTRFSLEGVNILTGPEVVADGEGTLPNMYGSTFWTSPQSVWSWPPEVALDSDPHVARVDGDVLHLVSQPGATTGYGVQKRFALDVLRGRIAIEYALKNHSATLPAAPWEVTRVPKEGLAFFPAASPPAQASTLQPRTIDGIAWVDVQQAPSSDSKLFQDGSEGWLAFAYRELVFIKVFDDVGPAEQASGEAEIEVFVNGAFDYVELEQQGPYAMLPAGASASWRVTWLLRRRPPGIGASVGNPELVTWVRQQVAAAR
jgi:hypothetical protein